MKLFKSSRELGRIHSDAASAPFGAKVSWSAGGSRGGPEQVSGVHGFPSALPLHSVIVLGQTAPSFRMSCSTYVTKHIMHASFLFHKWSSTPFYLKHPSELDAPRWTSNEVYQQGQLRMYKKIDYQFLIDHQYFYTRLIFLITLIKHLICGLFLYYWLWVCIYIFFLNNFQAVHQS